MSLTRIQFIKQKRTKNKTYDPQRRQYTSTNMTWATGWIWKIVHVYTLCILIRSIRELLSMANWVNGLSLLLLVFVRLFLFFLQISKQCCCFRCCSCAVPVWTRSLEKERERKSDMNKTTWNTVNWIRWAQNECNARKILTPFNYPTIRLPVPFVRLSIRSFVRSFAYPSIEMIYAVLLVSRLLLTRAQTHARTAYWFVTRSIIHWPRFECMRLFCPWRTRV